MKLYLARHGEYIINDMQRTGMLSEQGEKEIRVVTEFLMPLNIQVANIFHSGKPRAQQTAEILAKAFHSEQVMQGRNGLNPDDEVTTFVNEISAWEIDFLVVGHLPFLGRLAAKLIAGDENKNILNFEKGTIACLEKIDKSEWTISWVLRPDLFVKEL